MLSQWVYERQWQVQWEMSLTEGYWATEGWYTLLLTYCSLSSPSKSPCTTQTRLTHTNVWESMGKPCSCMQFIYNPVQVMQESVSGTASHMHCVWTCYYIEGSYDKLIITVKPSMWHSTMETGCSEKGSIHLTMDTWRECPGPQYAGAGRMP